MQVRGPVTAEDLSALLTSASDRDTIVEALFAYSKQFFDFTALFVVRGETAGGRMAYGGGASESGVRQLAVPLEIPSLFQEAVTTCSLTIGTLGATRLGRILASDLERDAQLPCVVAPVVLKKRAVILIYGDRDGDPISGEELQDLRDGTTHASNAFKRLIVSAKSSNESSGEAAARPKELASHTQPYLTASKPAAARSILGVPRKAPSPPKSDTLKPIQGLRETPPRRDPSTTVIVNMGEDVESLVDKLVQCKKGEEGEALQALLDAGELVLPVLVQRFPGPRWIDRRALLEQARGRDISAIARAIVAFGDRAVQYVRTLIENAKPDRRFYAVALAAEFPQAEVLHAVAKRLYDEDHEVRRLTITVLRGASTHQQAVSEALKPVRNEATHMHKDSRRRILAIRALGSLGDVRSIPSFVTPTGLGARRSVSGSVSSPGRDHRAGLRPFSKAVGRVGRAKRGEASPRVVDGLPTSLECRDSRRRRG